MKSFFHIAPTPRGSLFFFAVLFELSAAGISGVGFVLENSALMIGSMFLWLGWFVLLFLIAVPRIDIVLAKHLKWLRVSALAIFLVVLIVGVAQTVIVSPLGAGILEEGRLGEGLTRSLRSLKETRGYHDATALCHQAAENLIAGNDPYSSSNVVTAMDGWHVSLEKLTPLQQGRLAEAFPYPDESQVAALWEEALENHDNVPSELESRLSYPAGCFLLPALFMLLGVEDIRWVYLLLILPVVAYIAWRAGRNRWLLILGALMVSLEIWNGMAAGETGNLYFPFLLLAWVLPRRNLWLSALFMGVAVATKQVAWFFLPFYFVWIFRDMGIKRTGWALATVAGVFLVTNVPFILRDPELWFTSIMAPVVEPMFPLGVGFVNLAISGVVDLQSPLVFTVMELTVGILAIVWYYFNCHRYPHTGPVLAVLPLFFAWRSLWPYFYYSGIIVLAAVLIDEYIAPDQLKAKTSGQMEVM